MEKVNHIRIETLNEKNIEEVIQFYNTIHNKKRDLDKFKWEFINSPYGSAVYVIAIDSQSNKVVGTQCAIPIMMITMNGEKILTAKSEDTIVHPNYRGLNIFDKMYELLFLECEAKGIQYIWGFTSAIKPFTKIGFKIPFSHSQSLLVFDIIDSYKYLSNLNEKNNFYKKIQILGLTILSNLKGLKYYYKSFNVGNSEIKIILNNSNNSKDNSLIKMVKENKNYFYILQNKNFLNWRAINNPYLKESINIECFFKEEYIGNIIFNYHGNGVWYILNEIYSNTLSMELKEKYLLKAINCLKSTSKSPVSLIRTWEFDHNDMGKDSISIKERVGFYYLKKGIPFVWKSLITNPNIDVNNIILTRLASQEIIDNA